MKSLCVFCGSSPGQGNGYLAAARDLGRLLAGRGITLVFGGGSVGVMGAIANATLDAGGHVVGVIPKLLWDKEVGHHNLSELFIVETMHERKARMAELSDGFAVLPGGLGTLEEFFEVWTWGQLGIHAKPFGILNVEGYYDELLETIDRMASKGFIKPQHRGMVQVATRPEALLDALDSYVAPTAVKWMDITKT